METALPYIAESQQKLTQETIPELLNQCCRKRSSAMG